MSDATGPLKGVKVLEIAGVGPGPFCAMMLSDMGADVVRVERANAPPPLLPIDPVKNLLHRGRTIIALDLKKPDNVDILLDLTENADVLLEGYRPGVMERLGLGPEICLARNPALVYARMTGWGQDGPMAHLAGHDINYFAMSGSLWMCGRGDERPMPNLNLVADMGGGGMLMAYGIVCALLSARQTGKGQVVDASMTEGAALLAIMQHGYRAMDRWKDQRGTNLFDGGAHFYEVYETADGGYMAVGAIEEKFYAELLACLELDPENLPRQDDTSHWPAMRARFADIFASRTRAEWETVFDGKDACATPVLTPDEAMAHPHLRARSSFDVVAGVPQPMPAPRFSETPSGVQAPPTDQETPAEDVLRAWRG